VQLLVLLEGPLAFRDLLSLLAQELVPEPLGLQLLAIGALPLLPLADAGLGEELGPGRRRRLRLL
jgi:hypothetical protein